MLMQEKTWQQLKALSIGASGLWKQNACLNSRKSVAVVFLFALNILSACNCLHLI